MKQWHLCKMKRTDQCHKQQTHQTEDMSSMAGMNDIKVEVYTAPQKSWTQSNMACGTTMINLEEVGKQNPTSDIKLPQLTGQLQVSIPNSK